MGSQYSIHVRLLDCVCRAATALEAEAGEAGQQQGQGGGREWDGRKFQRAGGGIQRGAMEQC
jgi:hypothetical protein